MALYETKARLYLIGSNNTQTKFRVLKIDRTEPYALSITDDKVEYSQRQIKELLSMINEGNRAQFGQRQDVWAVTNSVCLWNFTATDLTHSLQYNMATTTEIPLDVLLNFKRPSIDGVLEKDKSLLESTTSCNDNDGDVDDCENSTKSKEEKQKLQFGASGKDSQHNQTETVYYGMRNHPKRKYVWNGYLLRPVENSVHPAWILPITHGFVAQSNISVYGRSFFLTLIARRSCCYAGTRFLKRGANFEGEVANEVETEQIVYDAHVPNLHSGRFTSFVQIRGSIPSHWSQDVSKMVPKPPIAFDVMDPYAETAGKHFNELLRRFGSPIIVLNLVKRRERRPHESILNTEYCRLIEQLNITLPPPHCIQYVAVDMARINKQKEENVMSRLTDISYRALKKTGIFQSAAPYYSHHLNPNSHFRQLERTSTQGQTEFGSQKYYNWDERKERIQTGVVRVNCVDCLDRTNTAQFCLGKCALAFQLYTLGVLDKPSLEFDSDCVRMLEEMYEDHGDTLALQYGGSQLVHRIKTYRRTAPWTSQGNDIMQTLSRYYSNTFSGEPIICTLLVALSCCYLEQGKFLTSEKVVTDKTIRHILRESVLVIIFS
ncbi:phosphatidylinositol-3,5-bisphosphate 5-phosphatase [Halocaridina rubra]|uniref:Phosphatidylinositol-3,5-bisphosphate 5-phosphatase n=1 Tax=Halocaridina rubra TaxID=373956 RepID=A0AAN8WY60_HALRR